jgi:hypothetical protein
MKGTFQNNIPILPSLSRDRYENIFKLYQTQDQKYFYNILNSIVLPESIDERIIDKIKLAKRLPWTTLSYQLYETQYLWWLIFVLNKPKNIFYAEPGIEYKYINSSQIENILASIESQLS